MDFELAVDYFIRVNKDVQEILKDASDVDKRREWEKLEDEIDSLRKKLVALGKIDPTQDISDIKKKFLDDAETPFTENHKWFVNQLKSTSTTSSTTASATGTSSAPRVSSSLTKRENVKLPWFYSDHVPHLEGSMGCFSSRLREESSPYYTQRSSRRSCEE